MAKTLIADLIVPVQFEKYALERTAALSALFRSGIVMSSPLADSIAAKGGQTANLPFWQDVNQARQIMGDSTTLTVNKITAAADICRIQSDAQTWSVNDLAAQVSGDDPLGAILDLVGEYWSRQDQAILISSLKGMFNTGGTLATSNKLSIAAEIVTGVTAATQLNGSTFVDATAKLGDAGGKLTAVAMHSLVEASLRKADLIDFIPDSEGKKQIATFQGRRVIVDDSCPVRAGTTSGLVYTSYLFGDGAFVKGVANLDTPLQSGNGTEGCEVARVPLDSDTLLINRRRFVLHPWGVKFTSASVAGQNPTNTELETVANWTRVREAKNVRIVAVDHNA